MASCPETPEDEWKLMWLAEVMRGDREFEEAYSASEIQRAREAAAGWSKRKDKAGNLIAEYQS